LPKGVFGKCPQPSAFREINEERSQHGRPGVTREWKL
jgi:hypothetical protein